MSLFEVPEKTLAWGVSAADQYYEHVRDYSEKRSFELIKRFDERPGHVQYVLIAIKDFDIAEAERLMTEATQHFKNMLDQSTFALCATIDPSLENHKGGLNFPWVQSGAGLEARLSKSSCKIPETLHEVFRSLRPYDLHAEDPGQTDCRRHMAQLANRRHDIGLVLNVIATDLMHGLGTGTIALGPGKQLQFLNPRWNAKKKEMIVAVVPEGSTVDYKVGARIALGFSDAPKLRGIPAGVALDRFRDYAQHSLLVLKAQAHH